MCSRRDSSLGVHSAGNQAVLGVGWGRTSLLLWGSQAVNVPSALGGVCHRNTGAETGVWAWISALL